MKFKLKIKVFAINFVIFINKKSISTKLRVKP